MTNTTGKMFQVTTFGSSHGRALGAVIDGCPANLELNEEDIQKELNKRRPGTSKLTSQRNERDHVEILSGIFNGRTDGTPIACIVLNKNQKSKDYSNLRQTPRPGHGDYTWRAKYGNYDYNGGGRGSGRATIGHVIGGAIAKKLLETKGIQIVSHVTQIGNIVANTVPLNEIQHKIKLNPVRCADNVAARQMEKLILDCKAEGDSVGGVVETIATGIPAGIGEPVFGKIDGDLAKALMEINAVKGVEIGSGFDAASCLGSENNDEFIINPMINKNDINLKKDVITTTNNCGGVLGGISDGMPIISRIAVKPTPSISKLQNTVNLKEKDNTPLIIEGRHDPCICPRLTIVSESATAIVLADHMIRSGFINPSNIKRTIF
ncbi:MAG: chorismate synthase [Methanobacteriaceae archaeon]|jgi:chorismate synthase|nr:chorismate synthase [Methanobacteriaceae archaeon]